jgi:hypothetical protein
MTFRTALTDPLCLGLLCNDCHAGIVEMDGDEKADVIKRWNHGERLLKVVGVTALDHDGNLFYLPKPYRHPDIIKSMVEVWGCKPPIHTQTQGFMLNDGRAVDRVAAREVARAAGQLLPKAVKSKGLFSEDVW